MIFMSKIILVWNKLDFGLKNFSGFGLEIIFGQKDLGPKIFCLKKQVGLHQGGGCMTPPPENSRVNILLGFS